MNTIAIRAIIRREVNDTLNDWRILAPMFILSFILPQLLIVAANYAIDFIDDPGTVVRLIPFVLLLVGFIPASFSLITALESFVGERERNSLEALLSMPISDTELYLGKLISSLLPPLLSSYLAMLVFTFSLLIFRPDLFFSGLNSRFLTVVLLLITTKALVMVASAVIISSHTTSVRAANLLASFVLLPTVSVVQVEAILMIGRRWDILQIIILVLVVVAIALIRTGTSAFNREEILSREHEQINLVRIKTTFMTFLREFQPAGVAPDHYARASFSLRRFYRDELPLLLREYRLPLLVALLAAAVGMLGGSYIGQSYQIKAFDTYLSNVGTAPAPGLGLALLIFLRNVRVTLLSSVFSLFSFGTFAFLVPAVAFAQISFVASMLSQRGGDWFAFGPNSPLQFLIGYVLPHGVVELPAAILGAAMGIRLGVAIMSPPKGFSVGQNILWALAQFFKVWALVIVPALLIGGLIEGLLSPLVVRALYG